MRGNLKSLFLLAVFSFSGCQCIDDDGFNVLRDAGFEEPDAGPPPPVFPLKAGDELFVSTIGGRTNCSACDHVVSATYGITKVELNDANRWEITANVLYTRQSEDIPAQDIDRLVLENVAPFSSITSGTPLSSAGVLLTTDAAALPSKQAYGPNNFPFFQGSVAQGGAQLDDSAVFNAAAGYFRDYYTSADVDPAADVDTQVGAGKMLTYYKDAASPPMLHKLLIEYHPMGFVCNWEERLIPFLGEDMVRGESSFDGVDVPPLVASWNPVALTRDGDTYTCSCFARTCRNGSQCLDPLDPDAAPGPCP